MSKSNWTVLIAIVILIVLAFIGGRYVLYGNGNSNYTPPERSLANVELEFAAPPDRVEATDNPDVSQGVVLVDFNHRNALFIEELNILFSKLVARGYSYELLLPGAQGADDEENGSSSNPLIDKLRYAKALILPLPRTEYTDKEIAEIERFVEKGGRVLIIGDPTRTVFVDAINTIASPFDIVYINDYLYSLENNDNNYRNVIYTNFIESPLTQGLNGENKVIFYSSSSINSPGHEIILGDEKTFSSISEGGRSLSPAVLAGNNQVLALSDLTFLGEPYSSAESNGIFINNIADFLTGVERSFDLKDFPYFFNTNVDVVFDNTLVFNSQFEDSVKLKEMLEANDHNVRFVNEISDENDIIFVGRFDEATVVEDFLAPANIKLLETEEDTANGAEEILVSDENEEIEKTNEENGKNSADYEASSEEQEQDFVEGRIQIGGVGELERGGSTLFHLYQQNGRNVLVILSDNPNTNADAFELLLNGEFVECLVSDTTAVCQTEEPDKQQLPSLRSTRIDKILVVSDDDGRPREDRQTSAADYNNALGDTYNIDIWETSDDGSPDLAELQEYDAIIWTTGDYWDDSIGAEDAQLLTEYIEAGGNLILSGASIAFDWDHTDFLSNIVHADYVTFAEQQDLELALADHPIARDFEEGVVITFEDTPSDEPLEPDVVSHTADARVIFRRGPESDEAGAAAVIAFEDDRAKVAYFAFPIYLLPEQEQALLINNTVDWFTRSPLGPPDEDDFEPFESDGQPEEEEEQEPTDEESEPENGQEEQSEEENTDNQEG